MDNWAIIENELVVNRIVYDKEDGEIFAGPGQIAVKETIDTGNSAIGFAYYPALKKFQPACPADGSTWDLEAFDWILPVIEEA